MKIKSTSSKNTEKIAEKIALKIESKNNDSAFFIGLNGDLGGGKTTFVKGFSRGLKIKDKILSPTFVIFKKYPIVKNRYFNCLYHFDCYRIESDKELDVLNFKDIVNNPKNIVIVEWSCRIKNSIPQKSLIINLSFIDEKSRCLIIKRGKSLLENISF